ncbi:protein prenylyltransferase [Gymnopus androsaceus JB14]|uniref:Geranylgeranyl transferase type-2 subunit alpha n=1 Tax=Gymnopus androsaceus JB14 TaxID=1447944 RepID=A0A6A4HAB3_9AGAR|nr:protein prenylyltransferase [Gymnopus androsaceus JB14]
MAALKVHPKVYWIWNHRGWCLNNVPSGPGTEDEGDPRGWEKDLWNKRVVCVLAWSYRRVVLASMPIPRPETSELAYTTRKIEANFSNFSAWHQRSKVLLSLWSKGELDPKNSREDEFDLVHDAMYTDPKDQSVWIYHPLARWFRSACFLPLSIQNSRDIQGDDKEILEREITIIQSLLDEEPDSKWCMESLVHYKSLLLRNHSLSANTSTLRRECIALLKQLREVDSGRKARYDEIELELAKS